MSSRITLALLIALLSLVSMPGCASMSQQRHYVSESKSQFPIFDEYGFGAFCYNTYGCKVLHDNFYQVNDAPEKLSPPPTEYSKKDMVADYTPGSRPFPGPVKISWRSLDKVPHEAVLDLDEIFKGHRLLYRTPEDQISLARTPHILVEVNDRTVNVYMRTLITLKDRSVRKFDDDLIRSYTRTY